ncbi:endonuclease domain-containing protein [Croceitalea marina]|uniref:Endonuclease domain-containing protein n=1 Tax=Croceitalea marina TaxID=1775166 RepID=A0ABW5MXD0_9FLAO
MKQIHNKKELLTKRKELRKNLTPAEAFLWKCLKAKQLGGRRFQKQHSIKSYIVDFYCAAEKLVIELDGEVHQSSNVQEYDEKRTKELEALGFTVIRFENKMVFDKLPSVLKEIKDNFKRGACSNN